MGLFRKKPAFGTPAGDRHRKMEIPEGLWSKCPACGETIYNQQLEENLRVCPKCSYHFPLSARARLALVLDEGTFAETETSMQAVDRLNFPGYGDRLKKMRATKGSAESVISGTGAIEGIRVSVSVMDFSYLGGSLGVVAGEKITRSLELARKNKTPAIVFSSSGGARMHEGAFSLMQMAKISGSLASLTEAGLPYISVLLDPTTGGVSASYATLGDLIVAEPGAMIGFAGPRVIKETTHQDLPKGFQTAEFLLERGLLDKIVPRHQLKKSLASFLRYLHAPAR